MVVLGYEVRQLEIARRDAVRPARPNLQVGVAFFSLGWLTTQLAVHDALVEVTVTVNRAMWS